VTEHAVPVTGANNAGDRTSNSGEIQQGKHSNKEVQGDGVELRKT